MLINEQTSQIRLAIIKNSKSKKDRNLYFDLCELKHKISLIQIKGIASIKQALISQCDSNDPSQNDLKDERIVFAQGYGLN